MKQLRFSLFIGAGLCGGFLGSNLAKAESARWVENRVIVKWRPQISQRSALAELKHDSFSVAKTINARTQVLRFASRSSMADQISALQKNPNIEWAQPDYKIYPFPIKEKSLRYLSFFFMLNDSPPDESPGESPEESTDEPYVPAPNPSIEFPDNEAVEGLVDPQLARLWGLQRTLATQAWTQQKGSRSVVVADIDTGTDYTHEDLRHNLWRNPNPKQGDLLGFDYVDNDAFPYDIDGHGTHTAGTIAATGDNGVGISGVAQRASIMTLRFIGGGYGTTSAAVQSIQYAIDNGARIINASWGGPADEEDPSEDRALYEVIEAAAKANILFVAAAGNDGTNNDEVPMYPAAYDLPNILTVASINNKDQRSFFSNFGAQSVDLGAPGSNVFSTWINGRYYLTSGTSMAAPHVSGLAALVLAERPDLSAVDVKQIIMESVDPIPSLQGITVSGGVMNVEKALERARLFGF